MQLVAKLTHHVQAENPDEKLNHATIQDELFVAGVQFSDLSLYQNMIENADLIICHF